MLEITSAFFSMAISQDRDLRYEKGLVVFPFLKDELPQDVLFIPIRDLDNTEITNTTIKSLLSSNRQGYVTYFQGIRWIQPDVLDQLVNAAYVSAELNLFVFPIKQVRIIAGTMVLDATPAQGNKDRENDPVKKNTVEVSVDSGAYPIRFSDLPLEMGVPKYFENTAQFKLQH